MKNIPKDHLEFLVRHFQESTGVLHADGIYGPKTAKYIDRTQLSQAIDKSLEQDLLQRAWDSALRDVGKGGQGGNNAGPYIRGLRSRCGFPDHLTGSWCAIFVSAMLLDAGGPDKLKSRGAYRLVEKLANHEKGREVEVRDMQTGNVYLAVWPRNRWRTHREAHIRLVKKIAPMKYEMIGGNERPDTVNHHTNVVTNTMLEAIMIAEYLD